MSFATLDTSSGPGHEENGQCLNTPSSEAHVRSRSKRRLPRGTDPTGPSEPDPSAEDTDSVSFAIAHDLRQPLLAAMLAVDGLGSSEDPRVAMGHDLIRSSLQEALERIRALLSLAGLERHPFRSEVVDLRALAAAAVHRATALRPEVPVLIELIGRLEVLGDPALVGMVVGNLVENAFSHASTPDRPLKLCVRVLEGPKGPEIVVEDDGPGVPSELTQTMFEAFARRAATPGNGLGLAIASRAARALGGRLEHESVDPHGARFRFILRSEPSSRS